MSFYLKIYQKKTCQELEEIARNESAENESRQTAINELKRRNELPKDLEEVIVQVAEKREKALRNKTGESRYNTVGKRVLANTLDGFVLVPISYITQFLVMTENELLIAISLLISVSAPYLYSILMHGYYGQTIGKMIASIKVIDLNEKDSITMRQAFYRDSFPLIGTLIILVLTYIPGINDNPILQILLAFAGFMVIGWSLLEIITMMTNPKRRALHDLIAKTVVIRTEI